MLADTAGNRRLIHRYIDVYEYPDGRIEVRAGKGALPYVRYDKLPQIDIAAVVENKHLDHALRAALAIQAQRDDPPVLAANCAAKLASPMVRMRLPSQMKIRRRPTPRLDRWPERSRARWW